jgi:hypothetical protein
MAVWRKTAAVIAACAGLGACTSDPAFWGAVAEGLDAAAYDLANEPVCNWYTDAWGTVRQYCQPAWQANQTNYQPVYVPPVRYRDDDRRDGRDRDGRGRRDDRRHDRDHDGGKRNRKD